MDAHIWDLMPAPGERSKRRIGNTQERSSKRSRAAEQPASNIVSAEGHQHAHLCDRCAQLNAHMFDLPLAQSKSYNPFIDVGRVPFAAEDDQCQLCRFFVDSATKWKLPVGRHEIALRIQYPLRNFSGRVRNDEGGRALRVLVPSGQSGRSTTWILPCVSEKCPPSNKRYPRATSLGSGVDFAEIKKWLNFCETHHTKSCGEDVVTEVPGLRLINVATREIVSAPMNSRFVALSYLWGPTVSQTMVDGKDTALPDQAPQVIEDALIVASQLGVPYVWIDRYCIDQKDTETKHVQIANMHRIYQGAQFTIIDAAGKDPHYGLSGVSTDRRLQSSYINGRKLQAIPDVVMEVFHCEWAKRGWYAGHGETRINADRYRTYQEGLLSRRRLLFTDSQVYFQCLSMHCCETLSLSLASAHIPDMSRFRDRTTSHRVFPTERIGKDYCKLYERFTEYLQRSLTFESDAINAFVGVLQAFKAEHFYGLPVHPHGHKDVRESFLSGLLWTAVQPVRISEPVLHRKPPFLTRRKAFPTWTWAGWDGLWLFGPGMWQSGYPKDDTPVLEVRRKEGRLLSLQDYLEEIRAGQNYLHYEPAIYLSGWTTEMNFGNFGRIVRRPRAFIEHRPYASGTVEVIADATADVGSILKNNQHKIIFIDVPLFRFEENSYDRIVRISALILQPAEEGSYTRLGVVSWEFRGQSTILVKEKTEKVLDFMIMSANENPSAILGYLQFECSKRTIRLV